jgi:hypothetical protein
VSGSAVDIACQDGAPVRDLDGPPRLPHLRRRHVGGDTAGNCTAQASENCAPPGRSSSVASAIRGGTRCARRRSSRARSPRRRRGHEQARLDHVLHEAQRRATSFQAARRLARPRGIGGIAADGERRRAHVADDSSVGNDSRYGEPPPAPQRAHDLSEPNRPATRPGRVVGRVAVGLDGRSTPGPNICRRNDARRVDRRDVVDVRLEAELREQRQRDLADVHQVVDRVVGARLSRASRS